MNLDFVPSLLLKKGLILKIDSLKKSYEESI